MSLISAYHYTKGIIETIFNPDETTALRGDKTIKLKGPKSKLLYLENLVQIWIAICTYLIVTRIKYTLKSTLAMYETMQILRISVFDKTPVKELLTASKVNQTFKKQDNLFKINDLFKHQ